MSSKNSVGFAAEPETTCSRPNFQSIRSVQQSVRHVVTFSERKFDVNALPADMLRVYKTLEKSYGEEYGLVFVFMMRYVMTTCDENKTKE